MTNKPQTSNLSQGRLLEKQSPFNLLNWAARMMTCRFALKLFVLASRFFVLTILTTQELPEDFGFHLFTLVFLLVLCLPASLTVVLHIAM